MKFSTPSFVLLCIFSIISISSVHAQLTQFDIDRYDLKKSIIGTWGDLSDGTQDRYTFEVEGYVTINSEGNTTGGSEYMFDGKEAFMEFVVTPIPNQSYDHIDVSIYSWGDISRLKTYFGIFELINESEMKLNINFDNSKRPTAFSEDTPTLIKIE